MQTDQAHPDISQLNAFALGRLDPSDIDAVESHLASCDTCCDALKQMKEDTFVGLVREARPDQRRDGEAAAVPASLQQALTLPTSETPPAHSPAGRAGAADSDAATVAPSGDAALPGDLPAEMLDHPRYHVLELLGVGGMGAVYKAEHRLMQRTVALKVINPKFIQSRQAVERFRREVQAAARLQHPNIVHAYDAEQAGNVHFLVMEYVRGTDLNQVLQERGPLPVNEACAYIRQAALGLQHAHEMGMVHRDIKPQNLMVVSGGVVTPVNTRIASAEARTTHDSPLASHQVKILDFGLASLTSQAAEDGTVHEPALEAQKSGLTQAGTLMGTPDYMAPEQARDARAADIRSDIYSLGCTLYTLLAGAVPFPGGSAVDKVIAHASNHAEPIEKVRNDVPAELAKVVAKMMAKAPAERYQTPAEVAAALAPFAGPQAAPSVRDRRRWRGRVAALAAMAAGALLLLAGVIFIRTNNGTLKIDCEVDDVQVVVSQGGEQFEVIDVPTGSTVKRLPTGNYDIALRGDKLDVKLDKNGFTITRSGLAVVKVTLTDESRQAKIEAATKAAERWLALMDAGEVEKAWAQSAVLAHKTLSREVAIKSYQNVARVVGKLKWRVVHQRDYAASRPGLPPGDYVKIDYASYFDILKETLESVFMTREKDGQWRPFTYATLAWPAGQAFPPPPSEPAAQNVAAALQGHWKPVAVEQNGQAVPAEALQRIQFPMLFLFKDGRWGAISPDGRRYESTFTLDTAKSPAWIEVKGSLFEGMPDMHGILKVEGDTVTVCVVEKDQPRPSAFTTKAKRGHMVIVARRISEAAAKIELATQAAEAWLKLADAGDYGAAWDQSANPVRQAVTKKTFSATYQQASKKLGKLESRTTLGRQYLTQLPGVPAGEYVLFEYQTSHENWSNLQQQVVATLDHDGQWRVSQNVTFLRNIPPSEQEFRLAVRAGRGELSKEEQQRLVKEDHPLAGLLADPGKKAILEWFAGLPDGVHRRLLKEGYLKWKVASLDAGRQQALRDGVKRGLDEMKKLGVPPPETQSLEALEKADVGFALVNVLGLKQSVVSWYLLFPASPQPGFATVVGPKDQDLQAWAEAHLNDLTALRAKPHSKSIKELAADDEKLQGTSAGPFVVLATDGKSQQSHATLAQAISVAKSGDTIEIRGNGPFNTDPIDIRGTALRIRAGAGYRPVIQANPEAEKPTNQRSNEPLLKTDAPLSLEGIEFQIMNEGKRFQQTGPALIRSLKAPLYAANCRFLVFREGPTTPCIIADGSANVDLRNCELLVLGHHHAVVWTYPEGGRLVMDNCVHLGFCPLATICLDDRQASVRIARSTLTGWGTFLDYSLLGDKLVLSKRKQPLEIDVSENAVEASNLLVCAYNAKHYPDAKQILELLPQAIRWRDRDNLYGVQNALLGHYGARPFTESLASWRTLAEWEGYWSLTDTKSTITKALSFAGDKKEADLRSKLAKTPDQFRATGFRLAAGSSGEGARKAVGADVDLVGPGAAYERWQQTPAFAAWRDALAEQGFKHRHEADLRPDQR